MSLRGVTGVKGVRPSPVPTVAHPYCAVRLRCADAGCAGKGLPCDVAAVCGYRVATACDCGVLRQCTAILFLPGSYYGPTKALLTTTLTTILTTTAHHRPHRPRGLLELLW